MNTELWDIDDEAPCLNQASILAFSIIVPAIAVGTIVSLPWKVHLDTSPHFDYWLARLTLNINEHYFKQEQKKKKFTLSCP